MIAVTLVGLWITGMWTAVHNARRSNFIVAALVAMLSLVGLPVAVLAGV